MTNPEVCQWAGPISFWSDNHGMFLLIILFTEICSLQHVWFKGVPQILTCYKFQSYIWWTWVFLIKQLKAMPPKMVTMVIKMVVLLMKMMVMIKMIVDYNLWLWWWGWWRMEKRGLAERVLSPLVGTTPLPPCHTAAQWLLDRRPTTSELQGFLKKFTLDFFPFQMCIFRYFS